MPKPNRPTQSPGATHGRHVHRPQPPPAGERSAGKKLSAAARQFQQRDAQAQADRKLQAENAELRRDNEFYRLDRNVSEIVALRIQADKLSPTQAVKLSHVLNNAMAKHKERGLAASAFDPYRVIDKLMVREGYALPKAADKAAPVPPPQAPDPRTVPVHDRASAEARRKHEIEHEKQARQAQQLDRDQYRAALRRLGLQDPAIGSS